MVFQGTSTTFASTQCPSLAPWDVSDLSLNCLVEKSQILRHITPTLTSTPPLSARWWRDSVFANRTAQTVALSALLGGLGTYFGAHIGTEAIHTSSAANLSSPAPGQESAPPPNSSVRTSQHPDSSQFVTHVVRENDTVWNLCVSSMGRYDETALAELRKLNPELIDIDRIEIGQQIRLPLSPSN